MYHIAVAVVDYPGIGKMIAKIQRMSPIKNHKKFRGPSLGKGILWGKMEGPSANTCSHKNAKKKKIRQKLI